MDISNSLRILLYLIKDEVWDGSGLIITNEEDIDMKKNDLFNVLKEIVQVEKDIYYLLISVFDSMIKLNIENVAKDCNKKQENYLSTGDIIMKHLNDRFFEYDNMHGYFLDILEKLNITRITKSNCVQMQDQMTTLIENFKNASDEEVNELLIRLMVYKIQIIYCRYQTELVEKIINFKESEINHINKKIKNNKFIKKIKQKWEKSPDYIKSFKNLQNLTIDFLEFDINSIKKLFRDRGYVKNSGFETLFTKEEIQKYIKQRKISEIAILKWVLTVGWI